MNGYEQALLFNNHGVALLASGSNEQREAIAKFRCALAVIKAGIIDESKKVGGQNKHSSYSNEKSTSFHSSQRGRGQPLTDPAPPRPHTACNHNHDDGGDSDIHDDYEHEPASNRNIQLNIQDFLEPIVIPFPDSSCNDSGGEDEDFFLYRHAFIISRSSAFSPSWEHSKEAVAAGVTTSPQQRKRSFPGAETASTTMDKNDGHTDTTTRMSPQVPSSSSSAKNDPTSIDQPATYVVDDPQEKCGSYSPLSLDLLSSVVVFNMALAHNVEEASQRYRIAIGVDRVLEGQRRSNLNALNDVSRRLYDMSIGLLSTVLRAKEVSKSVIEAMVVLAASSNNLAKILFDEGHIQTARSTLKTLWYTTSWICEKVLLPQQEEAKVSVSPWGGEQQQQRRSSTMTMSHVMPRPVSTPMTTITTLQPQNQTSSSHNDVAGVMGNRNPFHEIDGNFLARTTPGRERTTTASAFLFSESDIEGFIMNVMLMYHSQPPIVAKAA